MSTATLRLQYRALSHKIFSLQVIKVPWKFIYVLAMACSLVMLVFYVFEVNELIRGNFLIKSYTRELNTLNVENGTLQANFAQSEFLGNLMAKSQELGFEKTTKVTYMQLLQNSLAEAK